MPQARVCLTFHTSVRTLRGNSDLTSAPPLDVPKKIQDVAKKDVFGIQAFRCAAGHFNIGPSPFGCAEVHMVAEGAELIIGFPLPEGAALGELQASIKAMTGAQLLSHAKTAPGWGVPCESR